jgi:hypothetical protein
MEKNKGAQGTRTDLELPANLPKVSQPEAAQLLNVSWKLKSNWR